MKNLIRNIAHMEVCYSSSSFSFVWIQFSYYIKPWRIPVWLVDYFNMLFFALVSKEGKDKEQGPSRGPTRGPTLVVRPTTLGTGPWSQVRLPANIKPSHYNIILSIDLTKPNFNGTVSIWIKISIITSYILLHTSNMNVTLVEVKKESGGESSSGNLLFSK